MNATHTARECLTRQRLIEAASEVFIEQGFKQAKIRDIVRRAKVNVAAIHYHFGGKDGLYAAVIEHDAARALEYAAPRVVGRGPRAAQARLKEYIRVFLQRLLADDVNAHMSKLIAREIIEPTPAFEQVVEQFILPRLRVLREIVQSNMGADAREDDIWLGSMSVIGQCLYYQYARRVMQHVAPDFGYRPEDVERLAEHITAFSLRGLRGAARTRPARRRS